MADARSRRWITGNSWSLKNTKVRNNLIRLGGVEEELLDQIMEPIAGMEEPFRYRNKAQFPIGVDKEGNLIAGFYAGRTHQIIPVPDRDCVLGVPENKVILDQILDYMREEKISAYDENGTKDWCAMSWSGMDLQQKRSWFV